MSDQYSTYPEGQEDLEQLEDGNDPQQDTKEAEAAAENEGMQSRLGTSRVHPREDVDSAVPPRSGVGTSDAGVETTAQPPVPEQPGENAYDDPRRDDQLAATTFKEGGPVRPTTSGEKKVKYVGLAGSYRDGDTVFHKNKPTTVSGDDAARLTARRDFVSAD